jgi:hypothetical protein
VDSLAESLRVVVPGPLAEFELRAWSFGDPRDEPERFADEYEAAGLLRAIVSEGSSLRLRALVEQSCGTVGMFDEQELIERLAREVVRGTIEVVRRAPAIMATEPPEYAEASTEPSEQEPFVEPESVWLSVSAKVEVFELSVSAKVEVLELSVSAKVETIELETSHRIAD